MSKLKTFKKICITDYLNIYSDFREVKYKKLGINWNTVKHTNKKQDTFDFFNLFFNKYIQHCNIDSNSQFIFVLKKIYNYEHILLDIIKEYNSYNIKFIIIEQNYSNIILDKNKDDFLCQYFYSSLKKTNDCILVSNDKFRDRNLYLNLYKNISFKTISYKKGILNIDNITLNIDKIKNLQFIRNSISKYDLINFI